MEFVASSLADLSGCIWMTDETLWLCFLSHSSYCPAPFSLRLKGQFNPKHTHVVSSLWLIINNFLNNSCQQLYLRRVAVMADEKCRSPSATWQEGLRSDPLLLSFLLGHKKPLTLTFKNSLFSNSVYTNSVVSAGVHEQRPWWCYQLSFMLCPDFLLFDVSVKVPVALPLKMSLTWKCVPLSCNYALKWRFDSYTFTKRPLWHFGESFTLMQLDRCDTITGWWTLTARHVVIHDYKTGKSHIRIKI